MIKITRTQAQEVMAKHMSRIVTSEDVRDDAIDNMLNKMEEKSIENDAAWQGARE